MKKIISIIVLSSAIGVYATNLKNLNMQICSSDLNVADAARMSLELLPDNEGEDSLIKAFKEAKDLNLKAGIAYSLGQIQSDDAFDMLKDSAKEDSIVGSAAIFAIGNYKSKKAIKALNELKAECKNNPRRLTTIDLAITNAQGKPDCDDCCIDEAPANFDKFDENEKIHTMRRLVKDDDVKEFLLAEVKKENSDRLMVALALALQVQGGLDSLKAIYELKDKIKGWYDPLFIEIIAKTKGKGTDEYLLGLIKDKSFITIKAVGVRGLSSSEDILLGYLKDSNKYIVDASFDALASIGTFKAVKTMLTEMESSDRDYIKNAVKTLAVAITRLDDKDRAQVLKITEGYAKNAKENKDAYLKVLTFFDKK